MKTLLTQLIVLCGLSLSVFAQQQQSNSLSIIFNGDNQLLGINYHRNIMPWLGMSATVRYDAFTGSYSSGSIYNNYPLGIYNLSTHQGDKPTIATVTPDYMVPNGIASGINIMEYNVMLGLGFFVEKRGLFFKKLNTKFSSYFGTIRVNKIEEQSGYSIENAFGPNGEDPYLFNYAHYHYEVYWTKPYILLELQLDYTVYKDFFVGMNFNYMPSNNGTIISQYLGAFTLGTRF